MKWGNSLVWKSEGMKAIPRWIAGTAVVLAAALTTAPVTAGIADYFLNPGQQPVKRAAPALTSSTTAPLAPTRTRGDDNSGNDNAGHGDRSRDGETTRGDNNTGTAQPSAERSPDDGIDFVSATAPSTTALSTTALNQSAGLVADTAADARARVSELAGDLQSGVAAGEFSQADADRVLGDMSRYIRGERTWPERTVA